DMRFLDTEVGGEWDTVLSAGNSLAHLDRDELRQTARAARAVLRPGGVFLAGVRDYDRIAEGRPRIPADGRVHDTPEGKRILFQVWDWEPAGDAYTLNWFVLRERAGGWEVRRD